MFTVQMIWYLLFFIFDVRVLAVLLNVFYTKRFMLCWMSKEEYWLAVNWFVFSSIIFGISLKCSVLPGSLYAPEKLKGSTMHNFLFFESKLADGRQISGLCSLFSGGDGQSPQSAFCATGTATRRGYGMCSDPIYCEL